LSTLTSSSVLLVGALAAGFCGGRAATRTQEEVRAQRLLIVDAKGEVRGRFEVGDGSASSHVTLWMGGPGGKGPSATLWIDELEGTPEAALMLTSENGATHAPGKLLLRSGSGLPSAGLSHGEGAAREFILLGSETLDTTSALSFDVAGKKTTWPRQP